MIVRVEVPFERMKFEQMRHLLEVRRDVRVVPEEVDVVEDDVDDVLDLSVGRLQLAAVAAAATGGLAVLFVCAAARPAATRPASTSTARASRRRRCMELSPP